MPALENDAQAHDLDSFKPSPPSVRIDDKAARLEDDLADLKRRLSAERFISSLIVMMLFVLLVGSFSLPLAIVIAAPMAYLILLALGQVFGFPHVNDEIRMLIRRSNGKTKEPSGSEPQ